MRSHATPTRFLAFMAALACSLAIVYGLQHLSAWQVKPVLADPTGPAGVSSGLQLWLSASSGVMNGLAAATNGQNVTTWQDQSSAARNATGTGALYSANGLNFNPTIEFNDDNYEASNVGLATGTADRSIFVVASVNSDGWRYVLGAGTGPGGDPDKGFDFGHRDNYGNVFLTNHNNANNIEGSWLPYGTARLAYGALNNRFTYLGVNGSSPLVGAGVGQGSVNTVFQGPLNIGANSVGSEYWDGSISEVIFYNRVVTDEERQRINSYLALKYGFSLDQWDPQSYLASGSNLMWDKDADDADIYNNGLFGIGRDDASNLAQIKSLGQTATNILTIEADGEGTNGSPNFHDLDDLEFLVMGDNDGAAEWTETGAPDGYSILERQWKKQEQGDVGTVNLAFNVEDPDMDVPDALGDGRYYFIYDTDNDGILSDETPQSLADNDDVWTAAVNFGVGGLFTLATTELPALNSTLPADNSEGVQVTTNLTMQFSRSVAAGSGAVRIRRSDNNNLIQAITADSPAVSGLGTASIVINIDDLDYATDYYVLIDDNAFHNEESYFAGITNKQSWNFTTITSDADEDGISNDIEDAGPNGGDANGDSIADSEQNEVASLPNPVVGGQAYLSLEVGGDCGSITTLSVVDANDLDQTDSGYSYPVGLVNFGLNCDNDGDTALITIYFDQDYDTSTWQIRKLIDDLYSSVDDAELSTASVGGQDVTTLSYQITDGGPLDADGAEDGHIVDPIGPAVLAAAATPTPTPTPTSAASLDDGLPETGAMVKAAGLLGLLLIASGLVLRFYARRRVS